MKEMLTARQVQDVLKVDRTTIYRMLKDGRLAGVKVGNQWRFSVDEVEGLLSGGSHTPAELEPVSARILPPEYVQSALDVFAEMAEIGALITDSQGTPATHISNSCDFCNLIRSSKAGKEACLRSWQKLARQPGGSPEFTACHAGLQYARARIDVCGETIALLVGGQFYAADPDPAEAQERIQRLAREYHLDLDDLERAAGQVRLLDERMVHKISQWLSQVAKTLAQFSMERVDMLSRLQHISEMSNIGIFNIDLPTS